MPLFVFGSLRDPEMFRLLAGEGGKAVPSVLYGWRAERVEGTNVPMLVQGDGYSAEGLLWYDLTAEQDARLDAYELPWGYRRVPMDVSGVQAEVYMPDHTLTTSGEPWTLSFWDAAEGAVSRLAAAEIAAHVPPLSGDELHRQWRMIRGRAFAHHRALTSQVPATVRRSAGAAHTTGLDHLTGGFFKYRQTSIVHERFDGKPSPVLPREGIVAFDAALVLPYDPVRDRILLVEQFRVGPFLRHDANPWALEPVAGIIDAGETPEQAARREAVEEAGLALSDLRPMFNAYPTPGNSSEHFYCYLGLCDLPDDLPRHGGLEEEAEDIRIHLLSREQALALIDAGEITILPLIAMLYWLDRKRDTLSTPA